MSNPCGACGFEQHFTRHPLVEFVQSAWTPVIVPLLLTFVTLQSDFSEVSSARPEVLTRPEQTSVTVSEF